MTNLKYISYYSSQLSNNSIEDMDGRLIEKIDLKINDTSNPIEQKVHYYGPLDDASFIEDNIAHRMPATAYKNSKHSVSFEANYFPYVTFKDVDLPWRRSLSEEINENLPWLALLTLADDEFSYQNSLTVKREHLPNADMARLSAHIQLEGMPAGDEAESFISNHPAKAVSRLMCMRKLKPSTRYTCFIVSLYRWQGEAVQYIPKLKNDVGEINVQVVCKQWSFNTDGSGDFESLSENLDINKFGDLTAKDLKSASAVPLLLDGKGGEDAIYTVHWQESALTPLVLNEETEPEKENADEALLEFYNNKIQNQYKQNLIDHLKENLTDDRLCLPLYGRFYRKLEEKKDDGTNDFRNPNALSDKLGNVNVLNPELIKGLQKLRDSIAPNDIHWFIELNCTPAHRLAAGIGVKIIKNHQHDFITKCIKQLGDFKEGNRYLKNAQISQLLFERSWNTFVQPIINEKPELLGLFDKYPNSMIHNECKYLKLGINKLDKYPDRELPIDPKEESIDESTLIAGKKVPLNNSIPDDDEVKLDQCYEVLELNKLLQQKADAVRGRFSNLAQSIDEHLNKVLAKPVVDDPLYTYVRDISINHLVPNFNSLPENSISLYKENKDWIESLLVAANHEMGNETTFKELNIPKNHTFFLQFWDGPRDEHGYMTPDIKEIKDWNNPLGQNGTRKERLVFVLKSDIIRKYPNTKVYIQLIGPSAADSTTEELNVSDKDDETKLPEIYARLTDNSSLYGFDISIDDLQNPKDEKKYHLIIEQDMALPKHGLDLPTPVAEDKNDDLSWPNDIVDGNYIEDFNYVDPASEQNITSAGVALKTYQKPIRAILPINKFIKEEEKYVLLKKNFNILMTLNNNLNINFPEQ